MGWLSNIFKSEKQAETPKHQQEISLKDLVVTLEKKLQEKNSSLETELKDMHKKVTDSSRKFSDALNHLASSHGPEKIDDTLMNVAKSYRTTLIKAFKNAMVEFDKSVSYTVEDFGEYFGRCSSSLTAAENSVMRFVQPLKEIFPGEMKQLMKSSEQLQDVMSGIGSSLSKKSSDIKPLSDALKFVNEIESSSARISDSESEKSGLESTVEELKAHRKEAEQKISELLKSENWAEHQKKFQEIAAIGKKKDDILSVAVQSISPLDKAMKRLKRMSLEGQEKFENEKLLGLYITDPVEAFLRDESQATIKNIISKIKEASEKGTLEIDTRKEQKILEKLSAVESGDFLYSLRKDYAELEEASRKLKEELDSLGMERLRAEYENELKILDSKISDTESRLSSLVSNLEKSREERKELSEKLAMVAKEALGHEVRLAAI